MPLFNFPLSEPDDDGRDKSAPDRLAVFEYHVNIAALHFPLSCLDCISMPHSRISKAGEVVGNCARKGLVAEYHAEYCEFFDDGTKGQDED